MLFVHPCSLSVCFDRLTFTLSFQHSSYAIKIGSIAPSNITHRENGYGIDISGLGEGTDFYDYYYIQVQLYDFSPTWTIYNINNNKANHFVGETKDGLISLDLIRYTASNGITVTTGRLHERERDVYYEILPDATGTDTYKTEDGKEITHNEPIQLSTWQAIKSYFSLTRWIQETISPSSQVQDGTTVASERPATIDVMVIWTHNGECLKSGLESQCELTNQTTANIEAAIEFMVADSNVVHANSDTGVTLNLVHKQRDTSNFQEGDVFEIVLRALIRLPFLIKLRYEH